MCGHLRTGDVLQMWVMLRWSGPLPCCGSISSRRLIGTTFFVCFFRLEGECVRFAASGNVPSLAPSLSERESAERCARGIGKKQTRAPSFRRNLGSVIYFFVCVRVLRVGLLSFFSSLSSVSVTIRNRRGRASAAVLIRKREV